MRRASRSRVVFLSLLVALAATSLAACKRKLDEAKRAELDKAFSEYKVDVEKLQKAAAGLHARLTALPEDLPGFPEVRLKLLTIEEALGVEGARVKWISGELGKAVGAGSREQAEKVAEEIRNATVGNEGVAKVMVQMTHQLMPFERMAAAARGAPSGAGGEGARK